MSDIMPAKDLVVTAIFEKNESTSVTEFSNINSSCANLLPPDKLLYKAEERNI